MSWLKSQSSANANTIRLRMVVEDAKDGSQLDAGFTVLFYARTVS